MKRIKSLIVAVMLFCCMVPASACGGKGDTIIADPNTINIKVYKGGYNSEYIYALKEKFEALYAEEGYKVNILTPQRAIKGVAILQEIYADSKVDMYFANEVSMEQGVNGEYGLCLTNITQSVYNSKPIRFDGTEENILIKDKLKPTSSFDITASDGEYYGLPYVEGMGGMVFNKKILTEEYGMDTPRTTDELFECYAAIMEKAADTGVYPFTYISGANNYPAHMSNLWLAQYGGKEYYDQFWTMNNADGTPMKTDGFTVFENEAVEVMLRALYEAFDYQAAAFGSMTQDLATAQAQIMRGTAVFMSAGDYFFHEEALSFTDELNDISFMNTPVISELGEKLFGPQSSYALSEEKADDVLSEIVRLADENKSVDEIVGAVNASMSLSLNRNDVLRVAEARGYTYNRTNSHVAFISNKSEKKDICELFLRMCASDDGARLIAEKTYASNPFTGSVYSDSEYEFLREADRVANNIYKTVLNAEARGYRAEIGLSEIFPQTGTYLQNEIVNDQKTIYNDYGEVVGSKSVYDQAASDRANLIVSHARDNWDKWAV